MGRRCNYDRRTLENKMNALSDYLMTVPRPTTTRTDNFISLVHVDNLHNAISTLSTNDLYRLLDLIKQTLEYRSFPIICIHDDFKAHPNNLNRLRYWYKEILAEIAESDLLSQIFSDICGEPVKYKKWANIADKIRNSNYALS